MVTLPETKSSPLKVMVSNRNLQDSRGRTVQGISDMLVSERVLKSLDFFWALSLFLK